MSVATQLKGTAIQAYLSSGPMLARASQLLGRMVGRDPNQLTFYHQVDDPWSHLLAQVLPRLLESYDVSLQVCIVPPPASEADPEPERRRTHARRDAAMLAGLYGLQLPTSTAEVWPPVELTKRANAILLGPSCGDASLAVINRIGDALWRGDASAFRAIEAEHSPLADGAVAEALTLSQQRLHKAGHFQGGMLNYGGLWYWGVDRLHHLQTRLYQHGFPAVAPVVVPASTPVLPVVEPTTAKLPLEFFFSFRSPYSYLAVERTLALAERYSLDLRIRPVLPMVMRGLAVPLVKRLYLVKDAKREADHNGIAFGRICDPLGAGVERCLAVCPLAEVQGKLGPFIQSATRGIWSQALDMASDADLKAVTQRVGLDWQDVQAALADHGWRTSAEANRQALLALDMWGVPAFKLGTLPVWGQDRLELMDAVLASLHAD